jgi:hypothetical protein
VENGKMNEVFPKNLHFAFSNFHFSMKFSVLFPNAELIQIFIYAEPAG